MDSLKEYYKDTIYAFKLINIRTEVNLSTLLCRNKIEYKFIFRLFEYLVNINKFQRKKLCGDIQSSEIEYYKYMEELAKMPGLKDKNTTDK